MNINETGQLFTDAGFFDSAYSAADLVTSFVKVNIDDEVFEQAQLTLYYEYEPTTTLTLSLTLTLRS